MKTAIVIPLSRPGADELLRACGGELRADAVRGDRVKVDGESDCFAAWSLKYPQSVPGWKPPAKPAAPPKASTRTQGGRAKRSRKAKRKCTVTTDEQHGPGAVVTSMLKRMGFEQTDDGGARCGANGAIIPNCGCRAFARQMNRWGWAQCLTIRLPAIVHWFGSKARLCGVKLDAAKVATLLAAARDEAMGK